MKTQAKRKALRATDRSIARPDSASLNSSFLIRPSSFSRKGGGYILFELVLALEEKFGIKIPDDKVDAIKTVGDAVGYIREHIKS